MNTKWKGKVALFIGGQTISLFGSSLVQYAITWHILLETQSGIIMTLSIICGILPTFLISFFAGVWADRYNRKMLIIISDSAIALTTLALAILFLTEHDYLWLLFVALAIRALGTGVQTPAVNAVLPQISPREKLPKVNALIQSIQSITMLISPMLSGSLLTFASIEIIFFIDVATAAIAVVMLMFFLKIPLHEKALAKEKTGYFDDLKSGLSYINKHRFIKNFFIYFAVFSVLISPVAFLTPLQVTRNFGDEVWRLSALEILFSSGMIIGGLIYAAWGGFKNKIKMIMVAGLVNSSFVIALGFVNNFWVYIAFMGLTGITIPFFNTSSMVLLQQKTEENYLGRVFGVMSMISSFLMPMGMLAFGPLADIIRIEWMLLGSGALLMLLSYFMGKNKTLYEGANPQPAAAEEQAQ
jgi:DHA3 family macrolide efflux protein-like MFS transporter